MVIWFDLMLIWIEMHLSDKEIWICNGNWKEL
jgi:hypothetical protein